MPKPSREQQEHGWCLHLKGSPAFAYFLGELLHKASRAHYNVCTENPQGSREYHAGRLSALTEASQLIDKKYAELAKIVEVVPS